MFGRYGYAFLDYAQQTVLTYTAYLFSNLTVVFHQTSAVHLKIVVSNATPVFAENRIRCLLVFAFIRRCARTAMPGL